MKKWKPVDLVTLLIWGTAAAVWIVRLASGAISGRAGTAGVNITLAAVWTASLCIMLCRYLKGRKGDK